jgi:hypothetical protein
MSFRQKLKISIMKKSFLFLMLLLLATGLAKAQQFVEPFADFWSEKECYLVTTNGDTLLGTMRSMTNERGYITRLSMQDSQGVIHKFRAAQVQRFAVKPGALAKLSTINEKGTSVRHIAKTDYNDILDRDWIIFDQQSMPRTKQRVALLQLLNPETDEHIKVYDHMNGSKSMPIRILGIPIVGGEERTYWVVKDDADPVIVRKARFKKAFKELFADEPMLVASAKRKPKFKDFAQYISFYNQLKSGELSAKK